MSIIEYPYKFTARPYQRKAMNAILVDKFKHSIFLWHRRAGKTKTVFNILLPKALERVGLYYYTVPLQTQARSVVWDGRGDDGIGFRDHIPPELILKVNHSRMEITLKNGSIIKLEGSDKYQKLRGLNIMGIIFDEYSFQTPKARLNVIPILIQNNGFEIIIFTPHGANHAYDLYTKNLNNKEWYIEKLTIEDTKDNEGNPVIGQEGVESYKASGYSQDQIEQEFYCSFEAAVHGAIFSKELRQAYEDNRICEFPIDRSKPVYTVWDLGYTDATAIWFFQIERDKIYVIDYYEDIKENLATHINYVFEWREKNNIIYAKHIAPHDSKQHSRQTGKTDIEFARELGLNFYPLPRYNNKWTLTNIARGQFSKMIFHHSRCKLGIDCLTEYHKEYDEGRNIFKEKAYHNWASHGADAFQYLCQYIKEHHHSSNTPRILHNKVNQSSIF